jgi:tetratricopeptide (TPR) repeat protein
MMQHSAEGGKMDPTVAAARAVERTVQYNLDAVRRESSEFDLIENPCPTDKLHTAAMISYYGGYYTHALKMLNALVSAEPSEYRLVKLAQVQNRLGMHAEACATAQRAINDFRGDGLAYETLGVAHLCMGQRTAAKDALQKASASVANARIHALLDLAAGSVSSTAHQLADPCGTLVHETADPPTMTGELGMIMAYEIFK